MSFKVGDAVVIKYPVTKEVLFDNADYEKISSMLYEGVKGEVINKFPLYEGYFNVKCLVKKGSGIYSVNLYIHEDGLEKYVSGDEPPNPDSYTGFDLRQRTWAIFIKPPYLKDGEATPYLGQGTLEYRGCANMKSLSRDQAEGLLELYNTETSFVLMKENMKKYMDDMGYSIRHMMAIEVIPIDHIITPLT